MQTNTFQRLPLLPFEIAPIFNIQRKTVLLNRLRFHMVNVIKTKPFHTVSTELAICPQFGYFYEICVCVKERQRISICSFPLLCLAFLYHIYSILFFILSTSSYLCSLKCSLDPIFDLVVFSFNALFLTISIGRYGRQRTFQTAKHLITIVGVRVCSIYSDFQKYLTICAQLNERQQRKTPKEKQKKNVNENDWKSKMLNAKV